MQKPKQQDSNLCSMAVNHVLSLLSYVPEFVIHMRRYADHTEVSRVFRSP